MLCLHMWMLLVRLRSEGKDGKALAQMVYELFQENVEARVRAEGVKVSFDIVLECMLWSPAYSAVTQADPAHASHWQATRMCTAFTAGLREPAAGCS